MTPQDALQLLENATGSVQASRQDHVSIQAALQVLGSLVNPPQEEAKPEAKDKKTA